MDDKQKTEHSNSVEIIDEKKEAYTPPTIKTEELTLFGALCNGSRKGGRKGSTGSPDFCNANKLNS